ncbi:hypothetical protein [Zoogloea sp.]|uniref:hypothetical protein n=1 Tax=Zoogloea sp. TaxID=49181 RepID=UPI0035B2135F
MVMRELMRIERVQEVLKVSAVPARLLEQVLSDCGIAPVGRDAAGSLLWADVDVVAAQEAVRTRCKLKLSGLGLGGEALADVVREVLQAEAGTAVQRAVDRNLSTALDEMDGRLDKLQEGIQGLFRQQGANGQTLRDVAQNCAGLVAEIRAGNAAVKKDVGAALAKFEKQTEVLMRSVAEELTALRRSINEMARVTK